MIVLKTYRTELAPTKEEITLFNKCAGASRFVYNWGLNKKVKYYEENKKNISTKELSKLFNTIKYKEFPWILELPYKVIESAFINLDRAFKNFFRSCKKNKRVGFPKFKRKFGKKNFRLSDCIYAESSRIKLPILGFINLKEDNYIPSNPLSLKNVTISERADRWFISVLIEEIIQAYTNNGSRFSIDLGITSFAIDSDNEHHDSPKPLRKNLKKLQRLSRRHSRKQKGSKNREKSKKKLANLHFRISNIRKDFLHKESTTLTKTKSRIGVETLGVRGMMGNHKLARAISDESWSSFISKLSYKSTWYGCELRKAPRNYPSTKMCSNCGNIKKKVSLSERIYHCEVCGLIISRDYNAALNLLKLTE